jgi:hypothetical protein
MYSSNLYVGFLLANMVGENEEENEEVNVQDINALDIHPCKTKIIACFAFVFGMYYLLNQL